MLKIFKMIEKKLLSVKTNFEIPFCEIDTWLLVLDYDQNI